MRPTPAPGSSSLDPVHNFTRFKKSTGFCVELGDDVGLCAPHPAPGSSSLDPVHNFTRFKKSTGFCVELGDDVGLCAPHPAPGSSSLDPVHNFTGFRKSTGCCVRQQERMCCVVPRQRLSVRSGPGQLVDRGFSDDRHRESLLSRMRFIPKTASCRGEHGRNPTVTLRFTRKYFG